MAIWERRHHFIYLFVQNYAGCCPGGLFSAHCFTGMVGRLIKFFYGRCLEPQHPENIRYFICSINV